MLEWMLIVYGKRVRGSTQKYLNADDLCRGNILVKNCRQSIISESIVKKAIKARILVESLWIYYTTLFSKIQLKVLVDSFKDLFLLVSVAVSFKTDFSEDGGGRSLYLEPEIYACRGWLRTHRE